MTTANMLLAPCILVHIIRITGHATSIFRVDCTWSQWRTQEFCLGGSTNSVEDRGQRERGSGGGSPLVRGSGDSCNLVQEIAFRIVKLS